MAKKIIHGIEFEVIEVEMGERVLCDNCNEEWTNRPESGDIYFGSKAICPTCEPEYRKSIARFNEERFIKATCPPGVSFADWVRRDLR